MLAFYYIRTTATLDVVTKKDVGLYIKKEGCGT